MRHVLLVFAVALVLAIGLVLLIAGGEEDVVVDEPAETTSTQPSTEGTQPSPPAPSDDQRGDDERAAIERAVARYISAAERGEVDAPAGLPTTDELSVESVRVAGRSARVGLAGGAKLTLRKESGRWGVLSATVPEITPTPPSNGP